MLVAGTGDGVYRVAGLTDSAETTVEKVLSVPRAERVRQFDSVEGVFAATGSGLYHSLDGEEWTDLEVPEEIVYAVCVDPAGDTIYAGTRPARVYASTSVSDAPGGESDGYEWRELRGFRELPSGSDWGVPRHDNIAQVRSLHVHPDAPDRVIVGVEPGGVHVSEDRGETWEERRTGVHDDVHQLHVVSDEEYVAATGVGLFRTADAGRSWTRLDANVEQRYFRAAYTRDGVLYASAACVSPDEWGDDDANPALFECRDGDALEAIGSPRPDEVVVGWTTVEGDLVGATHRGTLLRERSGEWTVVGELPTPDTLYGRYVDLSRYEPSA